MRFLFGLLKGCDHAQVLADRSVHPVSCHLMYAPVPLTLAPTGECLFNGEECTLIELNLNNPTTPGSGSSADISLISPHAFNVPAAFWYVLSYSFIYLVAGRFWADPAIFFFLIHLGMKTVAMALELHVCLKPFFYENFACAVIFIFMLLFFFRQ
jgi:hypothetical protein